MRVNVSNTYEAAYYKLEGAQIHSIRFTKLPENIAKKKIRSGIAPVKYIFEMTHVHEEALKAWRDGNPIANVKDLMFARLKIKKKIAEIKYNYHLNTGERR